MALSGAAYPRVATALYELLTSDATLEAAMLNLHTTLNTGASADAWPRMVRNELNPGDPLQGPVIVFGQQGGGLIDTLRCLSSIAIEVPLLVKVICQGNSVAVMQDVVERVYSLLDGTEVTSDGHLIEFRAEEEVYLPDDAGGRTYQHLGHVWTARITEV